MPAPRPVRADRDGDTPEDVLEQLTLAWANVLANLAEVDMTVTGIVRLTVYLGGEIDTRRRRETLAGLLGDARPCTTVLYVAALGDPSLEVELSDAHYIGSPWLRDGRAIEGSRIRRNRACGQPCVPGRVS